MAHRIKIKVTPRPAIVSQDVSAEGYAGVRRAAEKMGLITDGVDCNV